MAIRTAEALDEADVRRYERDGYFIETLNDWPASEDASRTCLLLVKPEGLVGHRVEPIVQFLHDHGLQMRAWRQIAFTRHLCRALWHYEWWHVTMARMHLLEALMQAGPSVLLVLEDTRGTEAIHGSRRLQRLKGPTDPRAREPHQLRERLGSPSLMLNFVHSSDTSADVLREIAVFCDAGDRRSLYAEMARGRECGAEEVAGEMLRQCGAGVWRSRRHDLAYRASLERILAVLRARGRPVARRLTRCLCAPEPAFVPLDELMPLRAAVSDEASSWDWLVVATTIASIRELELR